MLSLSTTTEICFMTLYALLNTYPYLKSRWPWSWWWLTSYTHTHTHEMPGAPGGRDGRWVCVCMCICRQSSSKWPEPWILIYFDIILNFDFEVVRFISIEFEESSSNIWKCLAGFFHSGSSFILQCNHKNCIYHDNRGV